MPNIMIDEITDSVTDKIHTEMHKYIEQIDTLPKNRTGKLSIKTGLALSVNKRNRVKLL